MAESPEMLGIKPPKKNPPVNGRVDRFKTGQSGI
jgi:hypothetical protein